MKSPATVILSLCLFTLQAQVSFLKVEVGPVVNQPSDSRSCNFVDVNNDGWDDIFISNGPGNRQDNMLYLNRGDGTFEAVTSGDIVSDNSSSDGATFADADNDGDLDAFVVTWYGQPDHFYLNDGNGNFSRQTIPGAAGTYSETASWGDYNGDGLVDLFITISDGDKRNLLYRNLGEGKLEKAPQEGWLADAHFSRSVQWTDYDKDGDPDLFVSNENNQPNALYRNDGPQGFTALSGNAIVQAPHRSSTGSSWADVDNDGDLDLFVANYNQNNQLFLNLGNGNFEAVSEGAVVSDGGHSFGSTFADIDNDGDLDLFVANGFGPASGVKNFLYINQGDGVFERDEQSIPDLSTPCSFGAAWGDMDNDGFLDLVVANCNYSNQSQNPNSLFHNQGNDNHWIKAQLTATASNRSAIGAKIRIKATINGQPDWQLREISAQDGYNCQNSLLAHFGLGDATSVDSFIVEWPSGIKNIRTNLEVDTVHEVVEEAVSPVSAAKGRGTSLLAFPNPAKDTLTIKFPEKTVSGIAIYTVTGQLALDKRFVPSTPHTSLQLSLGGLQPGLYLLSLVDEQGAVETVEFIKQ